MDRVDWERLSRDLSWGGDEGKLGKRKVVERENVCRITWRATRGHLGDLSMAASFFLLSFSQIKNDNAK